MSRGTSLTLPSGSRLDHRSILKPDVLMANNIFEQFDEAYSRWSILDKVGKEMQLEGLWQQTNAAYNYLFRVYQNRGCLTPYEANYANQISQMLKSLQSQKKKVDQDFANEMIKHLMKMVVKQK